MIGAGQAGLSMSHHLSRLGLEHLCWSAVACRALAQRTLGFAGFPVSELDAQTAGLRLRGRRARWLHASRRRRALHRGIREANRTADSLRRPGHRACTSHHRDGLRIETDSFSLEALNVVVATGPYQRPIVPPFSNALPFTVCQVTANRYTNPHQLPPGKVLVVGSGGSGWQIAEDLLQSGRRVYLSVGRHRRVPRRYRGKDFGWWQEKTGASDQIAGRLSNPLHRRRCLTGVNGGHDADLRDLARRASRCWAAWAPYATGGCVSSRSG